MECHLACRRLHLMLLPGTLTKLPWWEFKQNSDCRLRTSMSSHQKLVQNKPWSLSSGLEKQKCIMRLELYLLPALHFPQFFLVLLNLVFCTTSKDTLCTRPWIIIWLTLATALPLTEVIQNFVDRFLSKTFLTMPYCSSLYSVSFSSTDSTTDCDSDVDPEHTTNRISLTRWRLF
jgi:hypothetical protein